MSLRGLVVVTLQVVTFTTGCVRTDIGFVSYGCAYPKAEGIHSSQKAVMAAREMNICIDSNARKIDEATWLRETVATEEQNAWRVSGKIPERYSGGSLTLELSKNDGHLLRAYRTQ